MKPEFIAKHPLKILFIAYIVWGVACMALLLLNFPFVHWLQCGSEINCANPSFLSAYDLKFDGSAVTRLLRLGGIGDMEGIESHETITDVYLKYVGWMNFAIYSGALALGFFFYFKRFTVSPTKTVIFITMASAFWVGGWWMLLEGLSKGFSVSVPMEIALTKHAAAEKVLNTAKTPRQDQ